MGILDDINLRNFANGLQGAIGSNGGGGGDGRSSIPLLEAIFPFLKSSPNGWLGMFDANGSRPVDTLGLWRTTKVGEAIRNGAPQGTNDFGGGAPISSGSTNGSYFFQNMVASSRNNGSDERGV